ncbi:MAG: hypothetical protein K2G85_02085 [Muribaculaceae bacterium]|nr:hypothetical protein [Muribaculaceae bacterium]
MNNITKKLLALSFSAVSVMTAYAQPSSSGYFLENYNMKWQLNPALSNRLTYIGIPGLGNINAGINGNLSATDIVYPYDGRTVLFTNPNIKVEKVMGNLSKVNRLSESLGLGVIQFGFKAFGGYNNFAINIKENMNFDVPKGLFSLAKEGLTNKVYDITDFRLKGCAYAEIALNHSREIKQVPGLRAGVSLKFMLPAGFFQADFNELKLDLGKDNWRILSDARIRVGLDGVRYETEVNDNGREYVSGVNTDDVKFGINGFGFGLDFGATYEWNDFTFSLAFTDLGTIGYNKVQEASTDGTQIFESNKFPLSIGEGDESWDNMTDDIAKLYELKDKGTVKSSMPLQGKMRAGVNYKFPFYKKLHFGLLNTTDMSKIFPYTEFRLSANIEPVNWFSLAVSGAAGTYGANYGFLLNLGNKGVNFVLGMDYAHIKLDKNYIPLTSNVDLHLGFNVQF